MVMFVVTITGAIVGGAAVVAVCCLVVYSRRASFQFLKKTTYRVGIGSFSSECDWKTLLSPLQNMYLFFWFYVEK